jgi:glycosyltransferase involved in cell wall biosynthesis
MKKPFLSIITPVYNAEETIERTIKSVIEQDFNDYEYIIVDGKSNDKTMSIVGKYRMNIDKIIREEDQGVFDAMNKGIKASDGIYVGIINSDDYYKRNVFSEVYKVVNKNENVGVVYSDIEREVVGRGKLRAKSESDINISSFRHGMPVKHPSSFVKKRHYEEVGGYDNSYPIAADFELMLRLCKRNVQFVYIEEVTAIMRSGGLSHVNFSQGRYEALCALINHNAPLHVILYFTVHALVEILIVNVSSIMK